MLRSKHKLGLPLRRADAGMVACEPARLGLTVVPEQDMRGPYNGLQASLAFGFDELDLGMFLSWDACCDGRRDPGRDREGDGQRES
jgi:hypothetical protein